MLFTFGKVLKSSWPMLVFIPKQIRWYASLPC